MTKNWIRVWIVPGAVFQSVTIGGGYGTGREVVEFISQAGPRGGLTAIILIAVLFGLMLGLCFDFSRQFKAYDYRSFMKKILGRGWVLYEVIFVLGLMLILAISASAAGAVFHENWGWPKMSGIGLMLLVIVWLTYYGRTWVEKSLTIWSVLVSLMLFVLGILTVSQNTETITLVFENDRIGAGWWRGGALFFMYNVMIVPTLMYTVRHINSRKQAWGAGLIGGFLTALPAFVYHLAFMSQYPAILDESLPTFQVVQHLGLPVMTIVYVVILFGAIANTGAGLLHGFNERLDGWWFELHGQAISKTLHASIAGIAVVASLLLANFGIIALVAKGYGSAAWLSLALLILPLLTVGTWKMFRATRSNPISEPKTKGN